MPKGHRVYNVQMDVLIVFKMVVMDLIAQTVIAIIII